jgi:hypothetical protein
LKTQRAEQLYASRKTRQLVLIVTTKLKETKMLCVSFTSGTTHSNMDVLIKAYLQHCVGSSQPARGDVIGSGDYSLHYAQRGLQGVCFLLLVNHLQFH